MNLLMNCWHRTLSYCFAMCPKRLTLQAIDKIERRKITLKDYFEEKEENVVDHGLCGLNMLTFDKDHRHKRIFLIER